MSTPPGEHRHRQLAFLLLLVFFYFFVRPILPSAAGWDHQVHRRLLLNESELAKTAAAGDAEASIAPISINDDPDISFRSPYEFIYARYDRSRHLQVGGRVGLKQKDALIPRRAT